MTKTQIRAKIAEIERQQREVLREYNMIIHEIERNKPEQHKPEQKPKRKRKIKLFRIIRRLLE